MNAQIQEGASNCVADCARVTKGQSVVVLNQEGAIDNEVSRALESAARERGAQV